MPQMLLWFRSRLCFMVRCDPFAVRKSKSSGTAEMYRTVANKRVSSVPSPTSARLVRCARPRQLVLASAAPAQTTRKTTKKEALKDARDDVRELIKSRHCNPILVRVAWHDSGTYDQASRAICTPPSIASTRPTSLRLERSLDYNQYKLLRFANERSQLNQ